MSDVAKEEEIKEDKRLYEFFERIYDFFFTGRDLEEQARHDKWQREVDSYIWDYKHQGYSIKRYNKKLTHPEGMAMWDYKAPNDWIYTLRTVRNVQQWEQRHKDTYEVVSCEIRVL